MVVIFNGYILHLNSGRVIKLMANLETMMSFCNMKSWLINNKIYLFSIKICIFWDSSFSYCSLLRVVSRIMPPEDVHVLVRRIREYIKFHGKGELRLQIQLQLLISWPSDKERVLYYSNWPNVITTWNRELEERITDGSVRNPQPDRGAGPLAKENEQALQLQKAGE